MFLILIFQNSAIQSTLKLRYDNYSNAEPSKFDENKIILNLTLKDVCRILQSKQFIIKAERLNNNQRILLVTCRYFRKSFEVSCLKNQATSIYKAINNSKFCGLKISL
ncbi:hypothetical protein BpHYR1_050941 [Brachionus plicatilis]|uniref:Uncharacterized protein n=1 Tax=Brachionus plicatilis TaxID=10195 RepID=A0A3M7QSX2_BRAPC|nr:hypothetical protein BpHYR1_050941 [Brachionus plicatilis]